MLTAFISDLHLHPDDATIEKKFNQFCDWATGNKVSTLYILGDFFHVWVGDDGLTEWSELIATRLKSLAETIKIFFIAGNRDFLIGKKFASLAGIEILTEPHIVDLPTTKALLVHGDCFCTLDIQHQRFRRLTNSTLVRYMFLKLPLFLRLKIAGKVRKISSNKKYDFFTMNPVATEVLKLQKQYQVDALIHGHTHRPGLTIYPQLNSFFQHFILSDWDDRPYFLCYDITKGFYFIQL